MAGPSPTRASPEAGQPGGDPPHAAARGAAARTELKHTAGVIAAVLATTVAIELAAYLAAQRHVPARAAAIGLAAATLWTILAAPVLAAGGRSILLAALRGGAVVDAGAVLLVVLWIHGASDLAGLVKIYLTWAAIALAQIMAVCVARSASRRYAAALAATAVVLVLAAAPFWANRLILSARATQEQAVRLVWAYNPFLAATTQLAEPAAVVWQERPILYEHTVLGRDVPLYRPAWYASLAAYLLPALALAIVARRRRIAASGQGHADASDRA